MKKNALINPVQNFRIRKRNRTSGLVILAVFIMTSNCVWAWGPLGHRVAAKMAQENLTPKALSAIHHLLGPKVNLEDISAWADEQKDISKNSKWHYVNIPITEQHYDPKYCPSSGCIVSKIKDFQRILQDPASDKRQKQEALKYLVHFIADLHNPLHVGDNGDQGGNQLQVQFMNTGTNLHRVWDSLVMERHSKNENVWMWYFVRLAKPKAIVRWSKGTPEDWATETLQVAKEAYRLPGSKTVMKSGAKLNEEYYAFAFKIIQKQLATAGIRTAYILNETFK
jgi:nuclease S1